MGGEIGVADQAAVRSRPGVDLAGDRAAVEVVGHQPKAAAAVGRRVLLGSNEPAERVGQVGVPGLGMAVEERSVGAATSAKVRVP